MEEPKIIITKKPLKEDFIMFNRVISNTEYHFNRSATIASIAMLLIWGPCILSTATHDPMLTAKLSIFAVLLTAFYNWYIRKRRDRRAAKLYEQNKVLSSMTKFKISLFDDHFESQTDTEQSTVTYEKLYKIIDTLERPLYFDPFGQTGFAPVGHNIIAPCKVLVQGSILFYPFRYSGFS